MTEIISQPHEDEVGAKARSAAKWVVGLLLARHAITFATTMVTSRLVSPADTGIAGMAATFVAFMVLLDTGLTWATVQPKTLTRRQVDTMFWIGAAGGLVLFCISVAASPLLAMFFHAPQLNGLGWVMGLTILFNSLTVQPSALLRRALLQKQNNLIDSVSLVASSIAAMGLAYVFRDYWALVLQALFYPLLRFCLLMAWTRHRISPPSLDKETIPILRKGLGFAASNYVTYVQLYLPTILVGWMFGDADLGYYTKAIALKSLPMMYVSLVVTDIMTSSMAVYQADSKKLGEFYRKALRLVALVGFPAGAMLFSLAPELVRVLYGPQWEEVVPLLKIMALAAMMNPISNSFTSLFLACGAAKRQFRLNAFLSCLVLLIFGALVLCNSGLLGVVSTEVVVIGIIFPPIYLFFSHRAAGISARATVQAIAPMFLAACCAASAAWGVSGWMNNLFGAVLLKILVAIAVYFLLLVVLDSAAKKDIQSAVGKVFRR